MSGDTGARSSIRYTERLGEAGIEPSVGSVGDTYENALAETINRLYKAEVIHRGGPWRCFEAVEYATLEWVDWLDNRRFLEPIGNIPPAETETNFCAALETEDMAAKLTTISLRKTRRSLSFRATNNKRLSTYPTQMLSRCTMRTGAQPYGIQMASYQRP